MHSTNPFTACKILCCWILVCLTVAGCHSSPQKSPPKEKDIVLTPEQFDAKVSENIQQVLSFVNDNKGRLNDTVLLDAAPLVSKIYEQKNYQLLWCKQEKWLPAGDSLFSFIEHAKEYGLFPSDYYYHSLQSIRQQIEADSIARKNAALWSRAEIMYTDAFLEISRHLKQGHFRQDSLSLKMDSLHGADYYVNVFTQFQNSNNLTATFRSLEPGQPGYDSLKTTLKDYLDSIGTFRRYTYLTYPNKDSAALYKALQKRFFEEDVITSASEPLDTAMWRSVLTKYQQLKGLKPTGKINENTVISLNNTEWEKFKRIAITLDRYRLMTDSLPATYIWVNIPAFTMRVMDADTVVMESRVIVGQPKTRTPLITSQVSNFITYPQWTVPYSIIFKEMLPQIKRNVDYLRRQNLMVVDKNDNIVNPDSVNWSRFSKNYFPYLLKQRQGDDNSLGVLKFNFPNPYDVYLHDTNARWLFSKSNRALSHGCVRVKDFQKLADFLVRNDTLRYHPDTLRAWIARQEKHVVWGFARVPIFIRYFTCEGKNGKLRIYDDIYAEDKILRDRYFADKAIQ